MRADPVCHMIHGAQAQRKNETNNVDDGSTAARRADPVRAALFCGGPVPAAMPPCYRSLSSVAMCAVG